MRSGIKISLIVFLMLTFSVSTAFCCCFTKFLQIQEESHCASSAAGHSSNQQEGSCDCQKIMITAKKEVSFISIESARNFFIAMMIQERFKINPMELSFLDGSPPKILDTFSSFS
ncbi:MAG: hypothetical protein KC733_09440, partial [Candidatus Omnitrophica bacterium]|nr:hypothetical protein [Candidatus Omnitrophota bacterium]